MALLRHTRLFRGALRGTSHALATPQFATWASTSRGAVRGLSTGSGQLSDSELQNIRKIAEDIEKNVQQGMEEMKEVYGADHADKVWMTEYYKHRQHKYFVPALSAICSDERQASLPSISSKAAVFFGAVLRQSPQDSVANTAATLTMTPGIDIGLLLAILGQTESEAGKAVADRLGASIRRSNNRALIRVGQHVAAVPKLPVEQWPVPHHQTAALHATWSSQPKPYPWEVTGVFAQARDVLDFHDWLLVSSTTHVECLWATVYATGSRAAVRRLLDVAVDWAEFSDSLPDALTYVYNIEAKLPSHLTDKSTIVEETARSVRAQVSRVAMWSLLSHSRRHPIVTEVLAEECGRLSHFLAEPSARDAAAVTATGLDEATAKKRIEVLPALLHLFARTRLDSPFPTDAA